MVGTAKQEPGLKGPKVTLTFNGHLSDGELIRKTGKRMLVRYTNTSGVTREVWVKIVPKPEKPVISPRQAGKLSQREEQVVLRDTEWRKRNPEPPKKPFDPWVEWTWKVTAEARRRVAERYATLGGAEGFVG